MSRNMTTIDCVKRKAETVHPYLFLIAIKGVKSVFAKRQNDYTAALKKLQIEYLHASTPPHKFNKIMI